MDLNELRKQVIIEKDEIGNRWQAIIGGLLAAALVCSFATLFVEEAAWLAFAAILFLILGLLGNRSLERGSLPSWPIRFRKPNFNRL